MIFLYAISMYVVGVFTYLVQVSETRKEATIKTPFQEQAFADALVPYTISHFNPKGRGPLDILSKTCMRLRNEIATWAKAKAEGGDFFITPSFGVVPKDRTTPPVTFHFPDGLGLTICVVRNPRSIVQVELFGV